MSLMQRFSMFLAVALCSLAPAWPCSFDPQFSYFDSYGLKDLYYLPETHFDSEYIRITGDVPDLEAENKRYPEMWSYEDGKKIFLSQYSDARLLTEQAEQADLAEALAGSPERDRILAEYRRLRAALREYAEGLRGQAFQDLHRFDLSKADDAGPAPFDLEPYQAALTEIPEEFSLYLLGAVAYHNRDYAGAKTHFQAVLALEPDKRKLKTVWAAYMLGRTSLLLNEPAEARGYFEQVRTLAAEGRPDPLQLAQESWGWQGQAHLLAGEYPEAVRAYVEFRKLPGKWFLTRKSFYDVFSAAFKDGDPCSRLARDPLARQLVTAWLTGIQYHEADPLRRWLDMNAALPAEGNLEGADGLAWLAYQHGDMDAAARWLAHSDPASPRAQFVKAKLLLREGNIEEGDALLGTLAAAGEDRSLFYEFGYPYRAETVIRSAYAGSLMKKEKYAEALRELAQTCGGDDAFIATRILTIPELAAAVESFKKEREYTDARDERDFFDKSWCRRSFKSFTASMEELLAQRLVRRGDWEEAAPHFSKEKKYNYPDWPDQTEPTPYMLAEEARAVGKYLADARNTSLPQRERAEHFFEAARIIRDKGDWLLGTWRLGTTPDTPEHPEGRETLLTDDALKRMAENDVLCGRKFYYRFMAADLMKQCAALLPDNDVLMAEALYLGGTLLKARYPEEADYFYKSLVRRNPNLLIARQADQLRWFPKQFTDVVLYTPLPKTFLRKRTLALLLGLFLLFLLAGGAWMVSKKYRPANQAGANEFTKEKL